MRRFLATVLLLAAAPASAMAGDAVDVRMGAHDGYGRVVFQFPAPTSFKAERNGDAVVLHFAAKSDVPGAPGGTRNIVGVAGGPGTATITLAPGAKLRTTRLDNRVVVDALDAAANPAANSPVAAKADAGAAVSEPSAVAAPATAVPEPKPARAKPTRKPRAVVVVPAPVSAAVPPAPALQAPIEHSQAGHATAEPPAPAAAIAQPTPVIPVLREATPTEPPAAAVAEPSHAAPVAPVAAPAGAPPPAEEPVSLAATRLPLPPGETGSALLLPFEAEVGAAAFRHGDEAWLVFDRRRPLDLAALGEDPLLAGAVVQLLPDATLVRLKMPRDRFLAIERKKEGWGVAVSAKPSATPPLAPAARPARLLLPATGMGQVVAVADPNTGQNLLVGTMRTTGPGVPVAYRLPEFSILPSWQGVVVEPLSDRTQLRPVPEGFAIETGDALAPPPDSARALADAATLTRRFDFPADPAGTLLRRLQVQVADQGRAPAQARLEPRKRAAQTMLSLGLGAEAQALLGLALAEDPRAVNDPDVAGLSAIAGLMSGRPAEAEGLLNPALTGSDEVALWRAVRATMLRPDSPEAAPVFAATIGLVLSYPPALRNRLLPLAAETMAEGGVPEAADALLAKLPDEPLLALSRALRLEAKGKTAEALTLYDALALGRDRLASARAAGRATLLRLSSGAIGPSEAADRLERQYLSWRGDSREQRLRMRVASLRAQAGQWRAAFTTLREMAQLFPDQTPQINAKISALMTDLLRGPGLAKVAPLELVSLAEENAEQVAQADAAVLGPLLVEKLSALDLPKRAEPVIQRMIAAAPAGPGRATLGARLAAIRLQERDNAGAAAALADSDAPNLPAALAEQRALIDARLHARAHDVAGATAILSGIDSDAADDLRATVLSNAGDWRGAVAALGSLVARSIPAEGALTLAQQDTLLRLASAQARLGDDASLRLLGMKEAARITGPRADMFRLLTAPPVSNVGDLKRSAGEVALARALPAGLAAIGTH